MIELILVVLACAVGVGGAMLLLALSQSRVLAERTPKFRQTRLPERHPAEQDYPLSSNTGRRAENR